MQCSVSCPRRVFLYIARRAAVSLKSRIRSSGSRMCLADPCNAISGELLPYFAPRRAMFTVVRSFRAAATLTLVLSHPKSAPCIALVVSNCCVAVSPIGRFPMRRQHGIAASILLVRVVPLRLAVVSTCVPRDRPSWATGMHCLTCKE